MDGKKRIKEDRQRKWGTRKWEEKKIPRVIKQTAFMTVVKFVLKDLSDNIDAVSCRKQKSKRYLYSSIEYLEPWVSFISIVSFCLIYTLWKVDLYTVLLLHVHRSESRKYLNFSVIVESREKKCIQLKLFDIESHTIWRQQFFYKWISRR